MRTAFFRSGQCSGRAPTTESSCPKPPARQPRGEFYGEEVDRLRETLIDPGEHRVNERLRHTACEWKRKSDRLGPEVRLDDNLARPIQVPENGVLDEWLPRAVRLGRLSGIGRRHHPDGCHANLVELRVPWIEQETADAGNGPWPNLARRAKDRDVFGYGAQSR